MISYAQNFEDFILNRAFSHQKVGFYIDIGAWHPAKHSVTKHFYKRGWSGINIEPSSQMFRKLLKNRPRDINLNIAIGERAGNVEYLEIKDRGTSTIEPGVMNAARGKNGKNKTKERMVEIKTLAEVCERHARGREIDFLKIDAEGSELGIIKGSDWGRFRPKIIVVESLDPVSRTDSSSEWDSILFKANYKFAYFDGINKFYAREENSELIKIIAVPPNVFDKVMQIDSLGILSMIKKYYRWVKWR